MIETDNFKFNKAELTDPADITELNKNFDIIDQELADVSKKVVTYTPFCVNNGSIDADGNENILYTDTTTGVQDVEFMQPILSENGTIGGSNFAVSGNNETWKLFDGNNTTFLNYTGSLVTINIYNPTVLKFNKISITTTTSNEFSLEVDGLNGTIWENIGRFATRGYNGGVAQVYNLAETSTRYNQIRIKCISNSQTNFRLSSVQIGAVYSEVVTTSSKILKFRGSVTATNANRKTFILNEIAPIDLSDYDNKYYSVFVDETGTVHLCNYNIIIQKQEPNINDVYFTDTTLWVKTLEPIKSYIYKNDSWVEFNAIPLGSISLTDNGIERIETYPYNQNGYSINAYSYATSNNAGVMPLANSAQAVDPTCYSCVMTPADVSHAISYYKVLKYKDFGSGYYVELRKCTSGDRHGNWLCDSDGCYLLTRQINGSLVTNAIKLDNPTIAPHHSNSLIDWDAMATACGVSSVQNINNTDWGVIAYGGDNTGTHSDGVEFYKGDIIIKKSSDFNYEFNEYDEIIIISCTDDGTCPCFTIWKKWELNYAFSQFKKFNLLKNDQWQWDVCGSNSSLISGRISSPYNDNNPRILVINNNDANNCGIVDIIGMKY